MTRARLAQTGVLLALLGLVAVQAARGTWPLDWARALTGQGMDATVLWYFRAPRILLAGLTGAALGLAGTVFQTMLRNPLASPDVIGFTAGAAAGAVLTIALTAGTGLVGLGALTGGCVTAAAVVGLSWTGGLEPLRLVLVGVGLGLTLTALTDFLLSLSPSLQAAEAARWLSGSFSGAGWPGTLRIALVLAVAAPGLAWCAFTLDRLDLGDELARSLGLRVDATRLAMTVLAAALVSVAVSVAGPLPFVALIAGPLARGLSGRGGTCLMLTASVGALVALAADAAASVPVQGVRLPAGVFTAIVGGPYMLALLVRWPGLRA